VNAEFAEGGAFELAIGRVIFDPLYVAAETVALVQHRHVTVGDPRAFIEMTAGKVAEAIQMRLDMAKQRLRQMDAQQVGQRRVSTIKIHARRIRRQQAWLRIRIGNAILRTRLH
jgi:hypothetical protein